MRLQGLPFRGLMRNRKMNAESHTHLPSYVDGSLEALSICMSVNYLMLYGTVERDRK
jgi:hypothetical protein